MNAGAPRVVAVVPVNRLDRVKSRLASVLPLDERQALVLWMAEHVVRTIVATPTVSATAVVSPDATVLTWAEAHGVVPLAQTTGTLNDGLALGREWAAQQHADALLIALADLPLLRTGDVAAAIQRLQSMRPPTALVLAPDRAGRGTNLLVARPPAFTPLLFGEGSLARYWQAAALAGITPATVTSEGTQFDIDLPADVHRLHALGYWEPCHQPFQRFG